jgi:hypothetical protein
VPKERVILLCLAAWRALFTGSAALLGYYTAVRASIEPFAFPLAMLFAVLAALVSADVIEHWAKVPLLGTNYNPYVMAIGEWEGWMGPTRSEDVPAWREQMCKPQPPQCAWWGDVTSFCA